MSIITRPTYKTARSAFFIAASALVFTSSSHAVDAVRKNPTSKLYIADLSGTSSINTGEKVENLTKKSVYTAEGAVIQTATGSSNAVVLSNGTGIAVGANTRVEMQRFLQEPFSPNRTDLDVEPSISQTTAYIPSGTVGLCTSKLVAGSTMTYNTPHASVVIRGRKVVIETTDSQTVVSLIEGDATIKADATSTGETLKPGQQAVVTRRSPSDSPSITIQPISKDDLKRLSEKVAVACMARKSVYFSGRDDDEDGPIDIHPGTLPPGNTVSPSTIP